MKRILVLDNYDSFTYNLVHILREMPDIGKLDIYRNDKISLEAIDQYSHILLSPGPGLPADAGIMPQLIKQYADQKSILGVCLGHQAIGESFGGTLHNLESVYHGVATPIALTAKSPIFAGLPDRFSVCRYHSWVVNVADFPAELTVTATDEKGFVMALQHRHYRVYGVQFHPESIMTEHGKKMIENWLTT